MDIYEFILIVLREFLESLVTTPLNLKYVPLIPAILNIVFHTQLNHDLFLYRFFLWDHAKEYDYVIIGGGSAGAVMASRLSEDPSVSVLLIEAGIGETILSDVPMNAFGLQMTSMDWSFRTTPQERACLGMYGRKCIWSRGKALGGSSTINHMLYVRGNARDYDGWVKLGAKGWSWREVFPYFIKFEDQTNPDLVASGYHGIGGPLTITDPTVPNRIAYVFQETGPYFGYPIGDINGASQSRFTIPQRNIRGGERLSTAKAYLESIQPRQNLHIWIRTQVTKILFDDNKRATGVEFERLLTRHKVKAKKEVILCAGAINSPQLLMLSGIDYYCVFK